MSIIAFVGLPGSGKSYNVVSRVILPALQSGRPVVTNIPLENLQDFENPDVTFFDIEEVKEDAKFFSEIKKGAIYVIDEAQLIWPSGLRTNLIDDAHKKFFSMHRHMVGEDGFSTEIVLVTQDLSNIANFVRQLIETTYRSVKLSAVGATKSFKLEIYQGAVTGNNPPERNRINKYIGKYDESVYKYYKSNTLADDSVVDVKELRADGNQSIFKSKTFVGGLIAGVLLLIWGVMQSVSFFTSGANDGNPSEAPLNPESVQETQSQGKTSPTYKNHSGKPSTASMQSKNDDQIRQVLENQYGFIPDGFEFQPVYLSGYINYGARSVLFFDYQDYHFTISAICHGSLCRLFGIHKVISLDHEFTYYYTKPQNNQSIFSKSPLNGVSMNGENEATLSGDR